MDPRLPYALGALAGMVRADAANEAASGSPDGTVSDMMRAALTVANQLRRGPGGVHAIRSGQWSVPAGSARDRLLCAVPIGIAMSTIDPEALAETVWVACGCTSRNEFQSAALLAAAVSLLINNRNDSPITTLCDAVDVVSAMKPRGERQEGPDVLTATRRALNVEANSYSPLVRVRTGTLMAKLADISPSHRTIPLAFFQVLYLWAKELPPAFREQSGDPTLYDAVSAALAGVCDTPSALRDLDVIAIEGVSHVDVLGIADQLLALSAHTPLEWIRRAAGLAPDRPPRSGPSSFEEPNSDLLNRYAPFEPESAPTPLGAGRGNTPAGRVVVMSELLLRFDRHSEDDTVPTENEWATREDVHLALPFTAMCAARAMGVEVISLSPIGQGPRASIIAEALAREGIVDAGPRVEGCDNGFLSPPLKQYGASVSSGMTEMPEDAWDEVIRTLGPSDVLYVDGGIVSQAVLAACEHALAHLPDHVRVILDASHGHVRQHSLPNDNVLIMVGYDSAEPLCRSVSYERPSGDCTKNPRHGAVKVQREFHQNTLVRGQTHESYLARAVQDKYSSDGEVTRFPAPTVTSTDLRGALHTSMGTLAAGFALGCTLERSIVLANCSGALASTMPGPASCPTREEVEAAADALKDRGDDYMRRRDRIYGALAGVAVADAVAFPVRGMSPKEIASLYDGRDQLVNASSSHPTMPGAPAGTITQITREVLAGASRLLGEAPSEPADEARAEDGDWLTGSRYVLRAIPVGLVTLTADPEVFADAVWRACGSDNLTCQEFQAAALVAAAVSLGLDWKFDWHNNKRSLLRAACEVVATLPPRGIPTPGADVLDETRRAIGLVKTFAKDTLEQLRHHVGTSADPAQSVPAACAVSVQFSDRFSAFQSVALGGEAGIISAIAGSIVGALYGVTSFSAYNLAAIEKASHPDLAPLADRLTDLRLGDLTSANATGKAAADALEARADGE